MSKQKTVLGVIWIAGLINGLLFTFLVPPWQHYDEPTQFEYAWLVANRLQIPKPGEYDQNMRREVAASMIEHGFFKNLNGQPDLLAETEPIWIGIPQVGDRPLYYILASLPLFLLRYNDITVQLYAARLVSLFLYLVTITAAYGLAVALTRPGHPLRWIMPLSLVLQPGFTDTMTSVNNDVAAVAFLSLFLWVGVRMLQDGLTLRRGIAFAATALLCWLTKSTVLIALPLAIILLIFSLLRGERRKIAWASLVVLVVASLLAVFSWGDAAGWGRITQQIPQTRAASQSAPLGDHVFQLVRSSASDQQGILQPLPVNEVHRLRGKTVTLGAWMWADREATVPTPIIVVNGKPKAITVQVGTQPAFYAFSDTLGDQLDNLYIRITPPGEEGVHLYLDGVLLAEGAFDPTQPPEFSSARGENGTWNGKPFQNLLKGASAEGSWPRLRPWFLQWAQTNYPSYPGLVLGVLLGGFPARTYLYSSAAFLFYTFWGRFGWGHVPLYGFHPYTSLGIACLIALAGLLIAGWRVRRQAPWIIIFLFASTIVGIWSMAWLRGLNSLVGEPFLPSARYAYPAIFPTTLGFILGWAEIFSLGEKSFHLPGSAKYIIAWIFFLGLDILGLISIYRFYYI